MRPATALATTSVIWTALSWLCAYLGAREAALAEAFLAMAFAGLSVLALVLDRRRSTRP